MHDEVAAMYMFHLASEMGQRMNAALLGDSSEDAALGKSLLFEPTSPTEVCEHLLDVGISLPTPEALHDVPLTKIANFAKNRAGERLRFRQEVEGIIEAVRSASDPNQIADYLSTRKAEIAEAVDALRKTQDELLAGGAVGMTKITVPTSCARARPAGGASHSRSCGNRGYGHRVLRGDAWKTAPGELSSPYHYLISIENDLGLPVV